VFVRTLTNRGGSLSVVIPREICRSLGLRPGQVVRLKLNKAKEVVIEKLRTQKGGRDD